MEMELNDPCPKCDELQALAMLAGESRGKADMAEKKKHVCDDEFGCNDAGFCVKWIVDKALAAQKKKVLELFRITHLRRAHSPYIMYRELWRRIKEEI